MSTSEQTMSISLCKFYEDYSIVYNKRYKDRLEDPEIVDTDFYIYDKDMGLKYGYMPRGTGNANHVKGRGLYIQSESSLFPSGGREIPVHSGHRVCNVCRVSRLDMQLGMGKTDTTKYLHIFVSEYSQPATIYCECNGVETVLFTINSAKVYSAKLPEETTTNEWNLVFSGTQSSFYIADIILSTSPTVVIATD